jgi:NAD-dependent SIR2 family protein deacetylase
LTTYIEFVEAGRSTIMSSSTATRTKKHSSKTNGKKESKDRQTICQPPFPFFPDKREAPSFAKGLESVATLLRGRKNIMVLTGAGISVSSGIPDFRSKKVGLYETLDAEALGLSCPEDLFDLAFFQHDPVPFYKFARQLYFPNAADTSSPAKSSKQHRVRPSDSHKLLALLDQKKKLLRCYTQNIDGLEANAGVSQKKIVYAHGSLQSATCCHCKRKVPRSEMEADIWAGRVATCSAEVKSNGTDKVPLRAASTRLLKRPREDSSPSKCSMRTRGAAQKARVCGGILKPGVTFFGEALGDNVRRSLEADYDKADALIVIGTSLSV